MPRHAEPWYRNDRGWYVQLDGKQTFLGEHPAHLAKPKKNDDGSWSPPPAIREAFHQKMADRGKPTAPIPLPDPDGEALVCTILDAFLDWLANRVKEGNKAQRTYDWYLDYLQDFARFQGANYRIRDMTAAQLEPIHVYQWVDSHPGWTTGKRGAMTSIQRAFSWAAKAGLLRSIGGVSPLRALEKPAQGRRERLFTEEEYNEVLVLVKDQAFRDLLELSWETGCRPNELYTVESAYVDLVEGRWVFPIKKSKGKKVQRVVYLADRALEITKRLMKEHPSGPLLLNTEGRSWCVSSVKCRFQKLCREIGRRRMKLAGDIPAKIPRLKAVERKDPVIRKEHHEKVMARRRKIADLARQKGLRLNLYGFRHARITEALVQGLDAVTVSILAGHKDTTMISRHYSHLSQRHDHMRKAANQASGPKKEAKPS